MPRARNRASSPAQVEEQADEMEVDGLQSLQFDEPLTWRAGKPIPVSELLRRLQSLYAELSESEQETANRDSLVPTAQELASPLLLSHKDKGVKAYTMLSIVEMFRLLAPDAPYKGGQLKEIFTLFVSTIIPALAFPSDPYNTQHHNALISLTTFKSIVLLADIPGSDHLILTLFTNCFDVLSGNIKGGGEQVVKNVDFHMTGILCLLVDECGTLPAGVTDIILAQFLRADPSVLSQSNRKGESQPAQVLREVSPAYNMARAVCSSCSQTMARNIGQYFSSVLIDASQNLGTAKASKSKGRKRLHDESDDEADQTLLPSEEDFHEVEKAHRLLRELWRSCPDVIGNVVPQIEAEISTENAQLRLTAVQTIGDMIAGIGAAGPPPPPPLDPAAYPSQSLDSYVPTPQHQNLLLTPDAPHAFSSIYPTTYSAFMDRHRDKASPVRSAWVTEAGRILFTSGGGKGLDSEQESTLLHYLSDALLDHDERVRLAAVQAIASFDFNTILQKLGNSGSVNTPGSVLCNLAERIKDTKHHVRVAATELLARIWGVAAGAIIEGSERARDLLGSIPSKIFDAIYINDRSVNVLVQRVMFESLLPVAYPPSKSKAVSSGGSQRVQDSQTSETKEYDPDKTRVLRTLALVRDLEEKARTVFFSLQQQQTAKAKYMESILQCCEKLHEKSADRNQKELEKQRDALIAALANFLPDSNLASDHLTKFVAHYDRRNFALVRFCYSPESDYRKVVNAMKELVKRVDGAAGNLSTTLETVEPFVRSASILVYNRSHVPAVLDISRTDEASLGGAAHALLKEISTKLPEVFKVHIKELCESLKKQAPSATTSNDPTAVDSLKACAGFAQRFPRDMPKDRDIYKAMMSYAKHGLPPAAAKHAISVIVASDDRKQMHIKDVMKYCVTEFEYGCESYLSRLAAMSQMRLLANEDTKSHSDAVIEIAVVKILTPVRTTVDDIEPRWTEEIDDDLNAKLWALKIIVNGLRGYVQEAKSDDLTADLKTASVPVFKLLNTLVEQEGELSKTQPTAEHHKARLRLAAAKHLLKLCCMKVFDRLFDPQDFNRLTKIAQDPLPEVRAGFVEALKKYLGQNKLPYRFYGLVFLYAFEPVKTTKAAIMTWLKSRATMFAKRGETVMQAVFARFLSLLAHHQDFSTAADELDDFVEYIMFYLKAVATQENLPQIYNIAQRLKSVQDGIDLHKSENLYVLSDLAEAVIRHFQELHDWSLQIYPGKAKLPAPIFAQLNNHDEAVEIAEKRYIPEELVDRLEQLVRNSMKTKKRKSDGPSHRPAKKRQISAHGNAKSAQPRKSAKSHATPVKTPKERSIPVSEIRKSSRNHNSKNYAENEDSEAENEDDEVVEPVQEEQASEDEQEEEANKENKQASTPPTSDPVPAVIVPPSKKTKKKELAPPPPPSPSPQKVTTPSTGRLPSRRTRSRNVKAKAKAGNKKANNEEDLYENVE